MEPPGANAAPVCRHLVYVQPYGPAPDHEREVDPRLHGVLDCPGQPRVDLHQHRAIPRVTAEFDLADPLQADGLRQAHRSVHGVAGYLDALPDYRRTAERRTGAVRDVPTADEDLATGDE